MKVRILGAGLAGSECAFSLARRGHSVELIEMRPVKMTPAHQTSNLGQLVCSNSLRSSAITNAVGLLKQAMKLMESMLIRFADAARVPAGDEFAVHHDRFADDVTSVGEPSPYVNV